MVVQNSLLRSYVAEFTGYLRYGSPWEMYFCNFNGMNIYFHLNSEELPWHRRAKRDQEQFEAARRF